MVKAQRTPRTLRDIKADHRVDKVWQEDDGYGDTEAEANRPSYWLSLKTGFVHGERHSIHKTTVKGLLEALSEVSVCRCTVECVKTGGA